MSITDKLVADAVYAIEVRGLASRGTDMTPIVRAALEAFEASLARCGCDDCATVRRENNGLSDHDRTALARALHELVYSPGATYDRAVPGIQEHILACAEKVAAALPWMRPATPTDDEREALAAAIREADRRLPTGALEHGEWSRSIADHLLSCFRRSEVPETSAEGYAAFEDWEQEMFRHQPVLSMLDGSIAGCQCLDRVFVKGREDWGTHLASVITARTAAAKVQVIEDAMDEIMQHPNTGAWLVLRDIADQYRASAVTDQGENR